MTPLSRAALILSCLVATLSAEEIKNPDCGGRGQRPCHIGDSEFYYNSMNGFGCDRGLKIDLGNFFKISDDQCVNDKRETGGKDYSWVGWALGQQRYGISAGEPINWVTTVNAHNAFNNENDNYFLPDQKYSITDLLNRGVRSLELDVHWAYGQVMLCHGQPNHLGCASWDRLYAYAIREIGEWLDANPGEVVHIDFEDNANSASNASINKPIQEYLGSKAYRTSSRSHPNYPYGSYISNEVYKRFWPTMADFKLNNKQVIITSSNTHGDTWIWPSTGLGFGDRGSKADITICGTSDGQTSWYQRDAKAGEDPRYWSRIYEGRAVGDTEPLMYEDDVKAVTNCGIGVISLGYIDALESAPLGFRRNSPDHRLESTIWSWAPNEDYNKGNVALLRYTDGRWLAKPNQNGEKHRFACFVPRETDPRAPGFTADPTSYKDPGGKTWFLTRTADVWQNGDNICLLESGGKYSFGAPRNAKMNQILAEKVRAEAGADVWLNYTIKPVPVPSVLGAMINFTIPAGSVNPPPSQQLRFFSLNGNKYSLSITTDPKDGNWLFLNQTTGTFGSSGASVDVSVNMAVAARLPLGPHTATITVTDTTLNLTNRVPVSLRIKIPTTTTLTSDWPADGRSDDTLTLTAKLKYTPVHDPGHGGSVPATGMVVFRELVETDVIVNPLDPNTGKPGPPATARQVEAVDIATKIMNYDGDDPNQQNANDTVTLKLTNLKPGRHRYMAYYVGSYEGDRGYQGDSTYAPSASGAADIFCWRQPKMTIAVNINSARLGENVVVTAQVNRNDALAPIPTGNVKFTISDINVSGPQVVLGTAPLVNGVATVSTIELKPGNYNLDAFYLGDSVYVRQSATGAYVNVIQGTPVQVTVSLSVPGLPFGLDNVSYTSPKTFTLQAGSPHQIAVGLTTSGGTGKRYYFRGWDDALSVRRDFTVASTRMVFNGTYETQYLLTVNRTGQGSVQTKPQTPDSWFKANDTVSIEPAPAAGYVFGGWTGVLSGSVRPGNVVMTGPLTVGATFLPGPTAPPKLGLTVPAKAGTAPIRSWQVAIANGGPGAALDTQITSVKFLQAAGAACTPSIASSLPVALGNIGAGATASAAVNFDFNTCAAAARFTITFHLIANGGSYASDVVLSNQFR